MLSLFNKTTSAKTRRDKQQLAMQETQVCPQRQREYLPRRIELRKAFPIACLCALLGLGASADPAALDVRDFATHLQYTTTLRANPIRVGLVKREREVLAAMVPKWAGRLFAFGTVAAVSGFVALWLTDSSIPALIMAAGLALNAICLRAGEHAIASVRRQ
jgi:hypothetical protein